jgi:hypothetical protein
LLGLPISTDSIISSEKPTITFVLSTILWMSETLLHVEVVFLGGIDEGRCRAPVARTPTVEILNFGPVIDPPFSDARSWREFVTPVETKVFVSEQVQPTLTVEGSQQAANLALASERVVGELKGKRYELMGVGMKSLDRRTEYPLVMMYNYTDDMVLEVLVDLKAQAVLDVKSERYQPAVVTAEMSRARDLVRQDGRLPRGGIDVETGMGLIVEDVNFKSPPIPAQDC